MRHCIKYGLGNAFYFKTTCIHEIINKSYKYLKNFLNDLVRPFVSKKKMFTKSREKLNFNV